MTRPVSIAAWTLLLAFSGSSAGLGQPVRQNTKQKTTQNSFLGKRPPDLVSSKQHWLGWNDRMTLRQLQGQVVWLQFNF